jgi:hypothetical protein
MTDRKNLMIEIVHNATGAVIVCDTFSHCIASDDGLAAEADEILAALDRGEFYQIGGGSAEGFTIQPAPIAAYGFAA